MSVSGGITELLPQDDRESFAARAEASLAEAKDAKRGTAVVTGDEGRSPKRNGTLHQLAPGEIVLEG